MQRVFDELVVTEVLSFVTERPRPMLAMRELTTGKNLDLSCVLHVLRRSVAIAPRLEEFNLTQGHACHPGPVFVDNPGAGRQVPTGTRDRMLWAMRDVGTPRASTVLGPGIVPPVNIWERSAFAS
jgi:hypothetical protein